MLMHDPPAQDTHQYSLQDTLDDIDEQSDTVLDDNILDDSTSTDMATSYGQRPEFTANHAFAPTPHATWQEIPNNTDSMSFSAMNQQHHFLPSEPASHYPHPAEQGADYGGHSAAWQHHSGLTATTQSSVFGTYSSDPSVKGEEPYNHVERPPQHGQPVSTASEHQNYAASATSPQSENGWMSTSSTEHPEKIPKREHVSPVFIDNPPRLRPDGVRKKNARFEIPEERKVDTIDKIISQTDPSDEHLLKELKQQKRLLRNRQAALDSRSRKKEHTQKLEDERKLLLSHLESLEEEVNQRRLQENHWLQERQQWQAMVDNLNMEKEELVRQHTLETAELRKKNTFLMEDAQRRTSISMSTVPSSAGYSSTFSEFDHLSMNDSPTWEDFAMFNHGNMESEVQKQEMPVASRQKEEKVMAKEVDKSAASGLLLTLLLCGAWVASRGAGNATAMPQMPEDVRAASTTVLDNIYKDAGLQVSTSTTGDTSMMTSHSHPQHHINPTYNQVNNPFASFHQLTTPNRQQQRDEIFSLTATQYNAMTTDETLYSHPPQKPRRNLQDALTALRGSSKKGSAADAYTRSLMMDEIPANVVRDFARMVGERVAEPIS